MSLVVSPHIFLANTCLNSGELTQAMKEVKEGLEKTPKDSHLKCMQALILATMERYPEAKAILRRLANKFTDLSTSSEWELELLKIYVACCQELGTVEEVREMLGKRSIEDKPVPVLRKYFLTFAYLFEFRLMHKTALSLFKLLNPPCPDTLGWIAASLNATLPHYSFIGPLDAAASCSAVLAERTIEKYIFTDGLFAKPLESLVDLYLAILHRNFSPPDQILLAFSKLKSPTNIKSWRHDDDVHTLFCETLARGGYFTKLLQHLKQLFHLHRSKHIGILQKMLQLPVQMLQLFDGHQEQAMLTEFLDEVTEKHPSYFMALANLEACRAVNSKRRENAGVYLEMAVKFGQDQGTLYEDIAEYLELIDRDAQLKLLDKMRPSNDLDRDNPGWYEIVSDASFQFFYHHIQCQATVSQRLKQANDCFGKYLRFNSPESRASRQREDADPMSPYNLQCRGTNPDKFLNQYALLAATILISEHWKECKYDGGNNDDRLITAICILEWCVGNSSSDHTARLLLASSYVRLGAVHELENILWDVVGTAGLKFATFGFLMWPILLSSGYRSDLERVLDRVEQMYKNFKLSISGSMVDAFKKHNFQEVDHIRKFKENILESTQRGIALTEKRLMIFSTSVNYLEVLKKQAKAIQNDKQFKDLADIICIDIRDLSLITELFENPLDLESFTEVTGRLEQLWFKTRFSLLAVLTKLIVESHEDEDLRKLAWEYRSNIEDWRVARKRCQDEFETPFYGVYPPLYDAYFDLGLADNIADQVDLTVKIIEAPSDKKRERFESFHKAFLGQAEKVIYVGKRMWAALRSGPAPTERQIKEHIQNFRWIQEYFGFSRSFLAAIVTCLNQEKDPVWQKEVRKVPLPVQPFHGFLKLLNRYRDALSAEPVPHSTDEEFVEFCGENGAFSQAMIRNYNLVLDKIRMDHVNAVGEMVVIAANMHQFVSCLSTGG